MRLLATVGFLFITDFAVHFVREAPAQDKFAALGALRAYFQTFSPQEKP
jgi:hypothetical protein